MPHPTDGMHRDPRIGRFTQALAARVTDEDWLYSSSSGGMTSWLLARLLADHTVDAVISVGRPGPSRDEVFGYGVAEPADLEDRKKSHYYASTMAEVLTCALGSNRRFALVGLPCFIRAARALVLEEPGLAQNLVFFVGLVCGHLKTQAFGESLAWQLGVPPSDLVDVDFRVKRAGHPANDYSFGARARGEVGWRLSPMRDLVGSNWGHGAFQPEGCNFCDDVVAETADVSFGDAWLPQFVSDQRGTNVVISRSREVDALLREGAGNGQIVVEPLTADEVAASQSGGFRHRREGLALRLADDRDAGLSVPRKRVAPNAGAVNGRRARLVRHRREMSVRSRESFARAVETADLDVYLTAMRLDAVRYRRLESRLWTRLWRRARSLARRAWVAARGGRPVR